MCAWELVPLLGAAAVCAWELVPLQGAAAGCRCCARLGAWVLVLLCALRSLGAAVSLRSLGAAVCVWDRLGAWLGILLYFTNSASASYWGSVCIL